ncbi:AAA family ATPase [Vagococcus fluvialis]|uniref:ATP-binding protein n=1 Tax=Vagococcus fluvialis TaxID=2738 RepID=UPI002B320667|nr:AAA family ATPase [Vagococcus fluvialis]
MKLRQLRIDGFGKFNNQVIDIDPQNQLIFGDNEAGKSSIYQFIRTILFGFPKKREMTRDFTPINGAIYGGKILFEDSQYGLVTVERYKEKNKGAATVTLESGETADELFLEKILSPLTKETFDQIFSFQQEQLADLNQLNEMKLQHLLLAVGLTGSRRLSSMNDQFLKERQKLFKPTGRIPEINQKLRQLKKVDEQIALVESQEGTYREKSLEMDQLLEKIAEVEKEQGYQQELEKTVLEQQKRFPMYIEWESLSKEFSDSLTASSQTVEVVRQEIQNYDFLLRKEKELLESQTGRLETESPAYQFYMMNQRLFDELLEEQLMVESLSERRQLLDEQLKEYQESKVTLFEKYRLSEETINIDLSDDVETEMLALAKEEEELIRQKVVLSNEKSRLNIRHKDMDMALTTVENQLSTESATRPSSRSKQTDNKKWFSGLSLAIGALFLVLAIVIGKAWLYIPVLILFGLGLYGLFGSALKRAKKEPLTKEEAREDYLLQLSVADEVAHSLNELETQLEEIESQINELQVKKQEWADQYGFSMKETMSLWLSRIPIYLQLQNIQEKETEMTHNLSEVDRILNSYGDSLAFAKEWVPLENKTTKESFQAIKEFVTKQKNYLTDKALATNTHDQFQEQLHQLRNDIASSKEKILSLIDLANVTDVEESKLWLKKQDMSEKGQSRKDELALSLEDYFDLNKSYKLVSINHQLIQVKNEIDRLQEKNNQYRNDYQALSYELTQMEKNGSLDVLYQEKENRLSVIKELADKWMTYRIAEELTQDVFQYLSDQQLPALLATVTSYFKILTEGRYIKVVVKDGQLIVIDDQQRKWPIVQLSTGTKDQLYMAFRLGFVHLHHEEYEAPVIIDDGWLHFDQKRKLVLFRLLKGFSQRTQVICLSSDEAVRAYFESQDLEIIQIGREEKS